MELKPGCPLGVSDFIAALDFEGAVVTPPVWIADLVRDRMQFRQSLLLGGSAHPWQSLNLALHRGFNLFDHLDSAKLGFGTEVFRHVGLSERFAEIGVHIVGTALPARRKLLLSAKGLAVEVEEKVSQTGRFTCAGMLPTMPAQVNLPVGQTFFFDR